MINKTNLVLFISCSGLLLCFGASQEVTAQQGAKAPNKQ